MPRATGGIGALALAIGTALILWAGANLAANLLISISFAAPVFSLYRQLAREDDLDLSRLSLRDPAGIAGRFQLTRSKLFAAGVIGVLLAIGGGLLVLRSVRLDDKVEIIAHRGSSKGSGEHAGCRQVRDRRRSGLGRNRRSGDRRRSGRGFP